MDFPATGPKTQGLSFISPAVSGLPRRVDYFLVPAHGRGPVNEVFVIGLHDQVYEQGVGQGAAVGRPCGP
jgi:hypothetical protein